MSTKEYGCFFCDGKSDSSKGVCHNCGKPIDIGDDLLKASFGDYKPISILGRGFYGWMVNMEIGFQQFAVKVIPSRRIGQSSLGEAEARAMANCSPHRNIARFFIPFNENISLRGETVGVYCLVFEFIENGVPLRKVFESDEYSLNMVDVINILVGIASGLQRMHSLGIWHYDLHDDNILIRTVNRDSENLPERYEPKLIDFGSVRQKIEGEPEPEKTKSDYFFFSKHILNLVSKFEYFNAKNFAIVHTNRVFSRRNRIIAQRLSDPNISRRDISPEKLRSELQNTMTDILTANEYPPFDEMVKQAHVSIKEPFANRDALNLTSQDVALLFRDSLNWQAQIEKTEPVLVVGPRGSGKTMLLRYLSAPSQGWPQRGEKIPKIVSDRLDNLNHIGFLLRACDIRTPFFRSSFIKLVRDDIC